ncbi:hypothetical protein SAMN03159463_05363 [Mesorhizobium sp. NFR06]|nr:hypothetical protein SAMN03159463_05363 [Mesorhizobium sp. NFR06]
MAAKRSEGVVSRKSPTSSVFEEGAGAPRAATPSVAFGDISPQGGDYSPGCLAGSECILRTRRTPHQTSRMATGTDAAVTTSGAKA